MVTADSAFLDWEHDVAEAHRHRCSPPLRLRLHLFRLPISAGHVLVASDDGGIAVSAIRLFARSDRPIALEIARHFAVVWLLVFLPFTDVEPQPRDWVRNLGFL